MRYLMEGSKVDRHKQAVCDYLKEYFGDQYSYQEFDDSYPIGFKEMAKDLLEKDPEYYAYQIVSCDYKHEESLVESCNHMIELCQEKLQRYTFDPETTTLDAFFWDLERDRVKPMQEFLKNEIAKYELWIERWKLNQEARQSSPQPQNG